jgi:hypothetical protein
MLVCSARRCCRWLIAEIAMEVEHETRDRVAQFEARAFAFAGTKGMNLQDLTPDNVPDWCACTAEMLAEYMDKNGELAHRLMIAYAKLRTDPRPGRATAPSRGAEMRGAGFGTPSPTAALSCNRAHHLQMVALLRSAKSRWKWSK